MPSHQVSLSGQAYKALREQRLPHESFSDAVLRLTKKAAKDPLKFLARKHRATRPLAEQLAEIEEWRNADRIEG